MNLQANKQSQANKQMQKQTDKQSQKQTSKQTDKQVGTHLEIKDGRVWLQGSRFVQHSQAQRLIVVLATHHL